MTSLLAFDFKRDFYSAARVMIAWIYQGLLRGDVVGAHHIPQSGPFLVASNHLSMIDPPVLGASMQRSVHYFARDTLFKPGIFQELLLTLNAIPVKRDSDGDAASIKRLLRLLQESEGLLLFPEGTRSLNEDVQPVKPGVGMLACRTRVPIIPARLFGMQKILGRGRTAFNIYEKTAVVFGPPLLPSDYDADPKSPERYQLAANCVRNAIIALQPPRDPGI